jgi:aminoglycoside phosphotransferase (APT) family kinase protein
VAAPQERGSGAGRPVAPNVGPGLRIAEPKPNRSAVTLQELTLPIRNRLLTRLASTSSLTGRHLTRDDRQNKPEFVLKSKNRGTRHIRARIPQTEWVTVVHGDYRLGNTVFTTKSSPRLTAILDWELATVGDPLADLGYVTATWTQSDYTAEALSLSPVTLLDGFPNRDELVGLYEERSGRQVRQIGWYRARALALWKASVFLEGNYSRWQEGRSDDAYYEGMGEGIPRLADLARADLER